MSPTLRLIGRSIKHYETVDSTNSLAASFASDPENNGLVVTASAQSAGRGQYDRIWQAPPESSILMSVLLFPSAGIRRPSVLTAWAAVSVCETLRQTAGLEARIKWPNDILVVGKKVCGILCEGGARHIVAGIGLNVNQSAEDFERMELPDAASLSLCAGRVFDVGEVTRQLIAQLDFEYDRLLHGEITVLEVDWKWRIGMVGKSVVVERTDGAALHGRLVEMSFAGIELACGGEMISIVPEAIRQISENWK